MVPYELIGRFTVALILALLVEAAAVGLLIAFIYVWVRFWKRVMEWCWKGYDPVSGDPPPSPKREIALIAYGLRDFKRPSEIHEAIKEAHDDG